MHRLILPMITLLVSVSITVLAQPTPKPETPSVLEKLCPFEYGCAFDSVYVLKPMPAFLHEGDTTSHTFSFKPGDRLRFNYGNMHVQQLGLAIIRASYDCIGFATGDSIYILSYVGEGTFRVWYNGTLDDLECFWCGYSQMCIAGDLVRAPEDVWWINVTSESGREFWLRLVNNAPAEGVDFGGAISFNWHE